MKLKTFRAILTAYDITKPKMIKINTKKSRVREEDIPTWDDVRNAVSLSKNTRNMALLMFLATTGLRISDAVSLRISNLLEGCRIYFDDDNYTIDDLLEKDPWDIVPCYDLDPKKTDSQGNITITFNTPECSFYIWQYLHERREKGPIESSEPLFKSERKFNIDGTPTYGFLKADSVVAELTKLNKYMGNERDRNGHYGKFRCHNLRSLFSTTCRKNISNVLVNADKTSEMDLVSLFTGHIPHNMNNSDVYEAVCADSEDSYIRKTYLGLIPYLSIQPTDVKDFKPQQYKDLEEHNKALEERIAQQDAQHQRAMEEQDRRHKRDMKQKEEEFGKLKNMVTDMESRVGKIETPSYEQIQEDITTFALDNSNKTDNSVNRMIRVMSKLAEEDIKNYIYQSTQEYLTGLFNNAIMYIQFNKEQIENEEKMINDATKENNQLTMKSIQRRQEIESVAQRILQKYNINLSGKIDDIIESIIIDLDIKNDNKEQFKSEFCTEIYPKFKDHDDFKKYVPEIKDAFKRREKLDAYLGLYNKLTINEDIDENRIENLIKNVLTKSIDQNFDI